MLAGCRCGTSAPEADWVVVDVAYPGASPAEVEQTIVLPVEARLFARDGLAGLASVAEEGRARVFVTRAAGDTELRSIVVGELEGLTSLPEDAERPLVRQISPARPRTVLVIRGQDPSVVTAVGKRARADLLRVAGVLDVELAGVPRRQMLVSVDPQRAVSLGLSLRQIETAIRSPKLGEASDGVLITVRETRRLDNIVVQTRGSGSPIYLRDLATIRDEHVGPSCRVGDDTCAVVLVTGEGQADPAEAIASSDLPPGVTIEVVGTLTRRTPRHPAELLFGPAFDSDELAAVTFATPSGGKDEQVTAPFRGVDGVLAAIHGGNLFDEQPNEHTLLVSRAAAAEVERQLGETPGISSISSGMTKHLIVVGHDERSSLDEKRDELVKAVGGEPLGPPGGPEVQLKLSQKARAMGVTHATVARHVRAATVGLSVGHVQDGRDVVEIVLRWGGDERQAPELSKLVVTLSDGTLVPLGTIAEIHVTRKARARRRVDGRPALTLRAEGEVDEAEVRQLVPGATVKVLR